MGRVVGWLVAPAGPVRSLAVASLVTSVGNGAFAAISVIFFVRFVGLSADRVGIGLALGGVCALFVGIPLGMVADRYGAKRVFIVLTVINGVAVAGYALVRGWAWFLVVATVAVVAERGVAGVRNAFIAALTVGTERVRTRAYLRSVNNVGLAIGAGLGGVALAYQHRAVLVACLVADATTFLVSAFVLARIPAPPAPGGRGGTRALVAILADRRFLVITLSQAFLSLHAAVLTIALPLWLLTRTTAPPWLMSVILVVTSVGSVLLQVRFSRGTHLVPNAARAARRAGLLLAGYCGVVALADWLPALWASIVLVAGALVGLVGALLQLVSGWGMSFALSPPDRLGAYQAAYSTGFSLAAIVGPLLCAAVVTAPGPSGWLLLGGAFLAAGFVASAASMSWSRRAHLV